MGLLTPAKRKRLLSLLRVPRLLLVTGAWEVRIRLRELKVVGKVTSGLRRQRQAEVEERLIPRHPCPRPVPLRRLRLRPTLA